MNSLENCNRHQIRFLEGGHICLRAWGSLLGMLQYPAMPGLEPGTSAQPLNISPDSDILYYLSQGLGTQEGVSTPGPSMPMVCVAGAGMHPLVSFEIEGSSPHHPPCALHVPPHPHRWGH